MKQLIILLVLITLGTASQTPGTLEELLLMVKESRQQSGELNRQREARFLDAANNQKTLLEEVKARLAAENKRSEQLKKRIDDKEEQIAKQQETLRLRSANLGEMFGVVRQISGDQLAVAKSSLVSAQFPNEADLLARLAAAKELPSSEDLRGFWYLLQQHMIRSGEVTRFDAEVIYPDGSSQKEPVLRIGEFTAIAGENFLEYSDNDKAFIVLPRQPENGYTGLAEEFFEADESVAPMAVDPTRGALLGIMMERPTLTERIAQGGIVGYIIILIGIGGILFALWRLWRLTTLSGQIDRQLADIRTPSDANPLGRVLNAYKQNTDLPTEDIEIKLDEAILKEIPTLTYGHVMVKLFAAIAPLLGLLGTVTGMIVTFQSITLFGTGDPKLMAGGISQALVTTVLGLVAAMPLLFLYTMLTSKSRALIHILSEQAAGMMAHSLERGRP